MIKLSNWGRTIWWLSLIGMFAFLFSQRYASIMNGTPTATDIIIFLMLIALLVIPLFREVNIFGVSLKKEPEYPPPSPDSKLAEIKIMAEETLIKESKGIVIKPGQPILEETVPNDVSRLFAVRYNIEEELNRLSEMYWMKEDKKFYPRTVTQKLEFLTKVKVIPPNLAQVLKEMYAQSSAAIHGQSISGLASTWIQQDAASTVQVLKSLPHQPQPAQATKVQRDD